MIKLENVSTNKFIIEYEKTYSLEVWYARRLLLDYKITDYQKLQNFLESETPDMLIKNDGNYYIAILLLKLDLEHLKYKIEKANQKGKRIDVFTFDRPNASQVCNEALDLTDERNKGKVLLCGSPFVLESELSSIRKLSISQIKHLLGHVDLKGLKNSLLGIDGITPRRFLNVINAINFYDEQVLRQYFDVQERDVNLFFVNNKEKRELASEQINDVAWYLADNATSCVWGNLTLAQKKIMLESLKDSSNEELRKIRGRFIDTISRYTTLTELQNGVLKEQEVVTTFDGTLKKVRKRPINRFIVK